MAPIDPDRARAFVLAKQGLGAKPGPGDVLAVIEATAGVYGTAPTCYLACAARLPGFRVEDLDRELYEHRSLVRLRCMRGSAYIEPAEALPAIVAATRNDRQITALVKAAGISESEYEGHARRVEEAIAGGEPATVAEIRKLLGDAPEALSQVVALMARQGRLVRATVRGGWKSDVYAYARWEEWVGDPLSEVDPVDARARLARRYFAAYGPATADDLRWWAGWKAGETKAALAALVDELVPVELGGSAAFVLSAEAEALEGADPESGRGTRLLPVWDSYLMGYRNRSHQVRRDDHPNVYDKAGNATSVVLVDGVVDGVWEFQDTGGEPALRVAPFGRAAAEWWRGVEEAAARIATMLGLPEVPVERAPRPGPLADGARNAFMAPIRLGPA